MPDRHHTVSYHFCLFFFFLQHTACIYSTVSSIIPERSGNRQSIDRQGPENTPKKKTDIPNTRQPKTYQRQNTDSPKTKEVEQEVETRP
jgi:hypothetical protein